MSAADLPPGDHPLEIAARRGIGPLSRQGLEIWHGNAQPCVSCGQLVTRGAERCNACDQDLSEGMLRKMRAHAGPWYVFDHVRPFPGVNLDRIVRQIRRGLLTETSIVRGPATDYQWRFAGETPGLCRYFGCCWRCHATVAPADVLCKCCRARLAFESSLVVQREGAALQGATGSGRGELPPVDRSPGALRELSQALESGELPLHDPVWEAPPRVGHFPVAWITTILLVAVFAALIGFSWNRMRQIETRLPTVSTPSQFGGELRVPPANSTTEKPPQTRAPEATTGEADESTLPSEAGSRDSSPGE